MVGTWHRSCGDPNCCPPHLSSCHWECCLTRHRRLIRVRVRPRSCLRKLLLGLVVPKPQRVNSTKPGKIKNYSDSDTFNHQVTNCHIRARVSRILDRHGKQDSTKSQRSVFFKTRRRERRKEKESSKNHIERLPLPSARRVGLRMQIPTPLDVVTRKPTTPSVSRISSSFLFAFLFLLLSHETKCQLRLAERTKEKNKKSRLNLFPTIRENGQR